MMTDERAPVALRNLSAEAALLGALIVNEGALDEVGEFLAPRDFSNPKNAAIYSAVCMSALEGVSGLSAIVEQLRKSSELLEISEQYLRALTQEACDPKEVRHNLAIVVDLSRKREKINAAHAVATSIANGEDEAIALDRFMQAQERTTNTDGFADLEESLTRVITGNYTRTVPTILRRSDGECLIYSGKLSWISAPPEALKSWTMLLAALQLMQEGKATVYLDFEDDESTVTERLYKLIIGSGIDNPEEAAQRWLVGPLSADGSRDKDKALFRYKPMSGAFDSKTRAYVLKAIKRGTQLVIIDGCATALAHANLNENDNADVNRWISAVTYPLTAAGAAVVVIDHVVKNAQPGSGGFGSRAPRGAGSKLAAVSGTSLSFEVNEAASVYSEGRITIVVTKDRPGRIKVTKRSGKRIGGVLMSTPMNEGIEGLHLKIVAAEEAAQLAEQKRFDLVAAEHISKIIAEVGPAVSKTEIRNILKERSDAKGSTGFRTQTTVAAFKFLVDNGYARLNKGDDNKTEELTSLALYKAEYGDKHAEDVEESPF